MNCVLEFTLQEEHLIFKYEKKKAVFDMELGYVKGPGSYIPLSEKPQINGVTLIYNKTAEDLHLQEEMDPLTVPEIEKILYLG